MPIYYCKLDIKNNFNRNLGIRQNSCKITIYYKPIYRYRMKSLQITMTKNSNLFKNVDLLI